MRRVLTVTMNPAVDLATAVDELSPQKKLRCAEPRYDPGGGGINVSRTIKELGGESTAFVMAGGPNGERLRAMLEERGIDARYAGADGDTRLSFHVTERASGAHYRFVLPGARQAAEKAEAALATLDTMIGRQGFTYVVASGSLPAGFPDDVFARLAESARRHGARLVLDTSGPVLRKALNAGVYLVRADRYEAEAIAEGRREDPLELAGHLVGRGAAEIAIITQGSKGAVMAAAEDRARIPAPEVEVVSAVGAGDSFVGALVFALAHDWPPLEAARLGVAAAAAACKTEATELVHKTDVDSLYEKLKNYDRQKT